MADMEPDQRKEECLTKFHSVYMNEKSYECAELAAGSAIELTKAILDGEIQNGLALLRPPGKQNLIFLDYTASPIVVQCKGFSVFLILEFKSHI